MEYLEHPTVDIIGKFNDAKRQHHQKLHSWRKSGRGIDCGTLDSHSIIGDLVDHLFRSEGSVRGTGMV